MLWVVGFDTSSLLEMFVVHCFQRYDASLQVTLDALPNRAPLGRELLLAIEIFIQLTGYKIPAEFAQV